MPSLSNQEAMLIELHGKKACANALNRFVIGAFTKSCVGTAQNGQQGMIHGEF
jgi:hypothetical protein